MIFGVQRQLPRDMQISVAMVSANFYPYIGGAEKQALEVARCLVDKSARVTVLTRARAGLPREQLLFGVRVLRLWAPGEGLLSSLFFLGSLLAHLLFHARDYEVFHAHLASSPAVAAALGARLLRKKAVVKLGGGKGLGEIAKSRRDSLGRLKLWALRMLRPTFIAVSQDQARELAECGMGGLTVQLIPNGVDVGTYRPADPEEKGRLRRELGWEGLVFLFVGRLDCDKGQLQALKVFLEGWSGALRMGFTGSFYMVGQGPAEEAFRGIVRRQGLEASVRILGPRQEVAGLYRAADVFVLPTLSEGLSNALLEALATGLPVFASRVTGTVGVVEEGVQGLLFDPASPGEVERLLKELSGSPDRLREMGLRARELAVSRFALERTAGSLIDLYKA